jgi:hypothetical protein
MKRGPEPLNLYRRRRQECKAGHPEESRSGEFEERKKGWNDLRIRRHRRKLQRKYGNTAWDDAKAVTSNR